MRVWVVKGLKFASYLIPAAAVLAILLAGGLLNPGPEPGELDDLARGRTDKSSLAHDFTEIYERFFLPLKSEPLRICEIGIEKGGSLAVWRDYFPRAVIFGVDIADCSEYAEQRVKTFVADQSKRSQLKSFIEASGGDFDILVDDGGHTMIQQQISLGFLFKHVKPGGLYVVEDVHTSLPRFYHGFEVDPTGNNSTLTLIHGFMTEAEIRSPYMTASEAGYLKRNIKSCTLFFRNKEQPSMTCIIKKKDARGSAAEAADAAAPRDPGDQGQPRD
jgi:hypothetical protein